MICHFLVLLIDLLVSIKGIDQSLDRGCVAVSLAKIGDLERGLLIGTV